ncbi:GNAT family N-acetyltransferase [Paenibacillus sp. HN-1]|uniref:GNAT family N-acetyltransferase n=1 Tax=Paenibacillus TaxID=44249 RepID=UPI001CA88AC9|nr:MULTISPECIES: GNAT family N-acetyltransferase [Paenibacillus]MBY9081413.1 GNAT family N-acetyltransferase [Paenibacillus sp. CGMCC 1.18879]MBY9084933.1 GNAT family N-acetyltransferase [Paenibacillus sinensis]
MIEIRDISKEDLPGLGRLYEELMGTSTDDVKLRTSFEAIERTGSYILLGAFEQNVLAGSLMGIVCQDLVGSCRPFMVIENVIVSESFRRRGIARALMLEIEQAAVRRDCSYIIVVSGGQRSEAHRLYEQLGYGDEQVRGFRKHI